MWPVKDSQPSLKQLMITLKKITLSHSYSSRNDVKIELCAVIVLSVVADKQVSPKSGTLKSPPKGFDTSAISKTYYNLVRVGWPTFNIGNTFHNIYSNFCPAAY